MDTRLPEGLREGHRRWLLAVEQGDLDGYAEVVAEDVVWIPPRGEVIEGRAAFRRWLAPFLDQYDYALAIRDPEFRVAGEWALEKGTFESRLTPRGGGETMQHTGRFIAMWRRDRDGAWRIDRYVDDTPDADPD